MNPVYTGAIASQKKDYRFKIGTIGEKKPEDWIVVELSLIHISDKAAIRQVEKPQGGYGGLERPEVL